MEARNRRTQKKPSEEANQVLQVKIEISYFLPGLNFELCVMPLTWNSLVAQDVLLLWVDLLTKCYLKCVSLTVVGTDAGMAGRS